MTNKQIWRKLIIVEQLCCEIFDYLDIPKKVCPICGSEIRLYVPAGIIPRPNARCPVCKGVERERLMHKYLQFTPSEVNITKVLHFAPDPCERKYFGDSSKYDYYPVDLNPKKYEYIRSVEDITNISYAENSFDLVICSHVLEHVQDDIKAISEMHRVLRIGGRALIMIPQMLDKPTLENAEYNTPELRLKHYGQEDHVRYYGNDFIGKLKKYSWDVKAIKAEDFCSEEEIVATFLPRGEYIYACTKQ